MAKRYDQMFELIDKVKPQRIIEVGVHRGIRAAKLCNRALCHSDSVEYVGYDVFDTVGAEYQEDALNGKGQPSEAQAKERLDGVRGLQHSFVIGDTRETLHGMNVKADFVFIDGDHRIDAIEGDYEALKGAKCVVFDDFYKFDSQGNMPDITLYGANATVDRLIGEGRKVTILPVGDTCKHGGVSHLAVVWK